MSTSSEDQQHHVVVYGAHNEAKEACAEDTPVHGTEAWFAEVVGLPNWGLDPRKDVNHVSNKDLVVE